VQISRQQTETKRLRCFNRSLITHRPPKRLKARRCPK
jgi:hypothetical protein